MQIADRHATCLPGRHPALPEEENRAGDPGPLRRPANGKRVLGHGTCLRRSGIGPTEQVWMFGLPSAARREIAAALEDWGLVPVALDGDPAKVPDGTPAALVVDVEGLPPDGLPFDVATRSQWLQVPVVALDEGLEELGRLAVLRAFSNVLVLPCREASTVVGALEWVLSLPPHRRDGPLAARGRAPLTRQPA